LLFLRPDRFGRMARIVRRASFHFHEHDRAAVDGYEIQLAEVIALMAADDLIAQMAQVARRCAFAPFAQRSILPPGGPQALHEH
jgi:hypothetical protein